MPSTDTNRLYTEDDVLAKFERALAQSSGAVRYDLQAAIDGRKEELRRDSGVCS